MFAPSISLQQILRPDGVETEDKADPYEIGKRPLKVSISLQQRSEHNERPAWSVISQQALYFENPSADIPAGSQHAACAACDATGRIISVL